MGRGEAVVWWCIGAEASEKHTHQLPHRLPALLQSSISTASAGASIKSTGRTSPGRWQTWASLGLRRPPGVPRADRPMALSRRARNGANFAIAVEIRPGLLLERGDGGGDGALRRTRCRPLG